MLLAGPSIVTTAFGYDHPEVRDVSACLESDVMTTSLRASLCYFVPLACLLCLTYRLAVAMKQRQMMMRFANMADASRSSSAHSSNRRAGGEATSQSLPRSEAELAQAPPTPPPTTNRGVGFQRVKNSVHGTRTRLQRRQRVRSRKQGDKRMIKDGACAVNAAFDEAGADRDGGEQVKAQAEATHNSQHTDEPAQCERSDDTHAMVNASSGEAVGDGVKEQEGTIKESPEVCEVCDKGDAADVTQVALTSASQHLEEAHAAAAVDHHDNHDAAVDMESKEDVSNKAESSSSSTHVIQGVSDGQQGTHDVLLPDTTTARRKSVTFIREHSEIHVNVQCLHEEEEEQPGDADVKTNEEEQPGDADVKTNEKASLQTPQLARGDPMASMTERFRRLDAMATTVVATSVGFIVLSLPYQIYVCVRAASVHNSSSDQHVSMALDALFWLAITFNVANPAVYILGSKK